MRISRLASVFVLFVLALCLAEPARAGGTLKELARGAVSENAEERAASVAALRGRGQAGLDALFEEYAFEIRRQSGAPATGPESKGGEWARLAEALDAVSQQRDSFASRLYWHTDIEEAKRAARSTGKPILSLRLLGKLSEEYSCANSRFFRTVLYSNASVSKFLREHFVLHWKSVRPAPRVTIDFGDGRKLERTLTGNSIHYVLDPEGWPVDALPGLYGPQAFVRELERADEAARAAARLGGQEREQFLFNYYNSRGLGLIGSLRSDAARAGIALPEAVVKRDGGAAPRTAIGPRPTAIQAMGRAATKMLVEARTVRAASYSGPSYPGPSYTVASNTRYDPALFERSVDEAGWTKIAALHLADARMDATSVALLARHNPYTEASPQAKTAAALTPERLARVVANLERSMALDTVRNQYLLRPVLLNWFLDGAVRLDVEKLNERVYAELFLTPNSDPWLGLLTPDTYTGIENDGVILNR